ncbi:MAG: pilus assembly protein PilM [Patescibacteria group bacterium]
MSLASTFFKYFPTPRFLAMPHAGVDISPTAIRFVELNKTPRGLEIGSFGEQLLSTELQVGEPLAINNDLIAALKKMQRSNELSFVEASIPEEKAYVFTTEIPIGNEESVRNHIEFHLEENVPVTLADAVYDYFVIRKNEKTNTFFASVSVVPMAVIEDYIQLFSKCGMTVVSFLIENQALTRSVIAKGDKRTTLLVSVRHRKSVLSVISEEAVQFTSTIPIGSQDFTAAIMKEFNIGEEEARKVKREKGFVRSKENEAIFMSLINTASALKDEITRVYTYWESYRDKSKGGDVLLSSIGRIVLSGRDASLAGFREYIALSMHIDVELANVWTNIMSFDKAIPQIEYAESLNYGMAIGLALPKQKDI